MLTKSAGNPNKSKPNSALSTYTIYLLATASLLGLASTEAQANFAAPYQYEGDWTTTITTGSNAYVDNTLPGGVTIHGADDGGYPVTVGDISITRVATSDGLWSFSWEYSSDNPLTNPKDYAYYKINSVLYTISDSDKFPFPASGQKNLIQITAGDIFGFTLSDNSGWPAYLKITNFEINSTTNVPEPETFLLMSAGLAVLLFSYKKQRI